MYVVLTIEETKFIFIKLFSVKYYSLEIYFQICIMHKLNKTLN